MKKKKKILVAPLDWGIGHATRCIPIIRELIKENYEVILAADDRPMHLLNIEFPKLEMIRFSGYKIKYPRYLPMSMSMLLQSPKIILAIKKEHQVLQSIILDYNIDGVISDNRFGLYSNKIPTVFITHQLEIQSYYLTNIIQKLNYKYINRYKQCWIMDDYDLNLAGKLSKPKTLPNNTVYIGSQSRFIKTKKEKKYDYLAIVSGPEPQRSILEKGLINCLKNSSKKSLIVLGKPEVNKDQQIKNLTIKSHLDAKQLNNAILQSELIICRPGYSTIMDLMKLEKKAILIPTPGQTEQEYLAKKFMQEDVFFSQHQNEFDFEKAVIESKHYKGFSAIKKEDTDWKKLFSLF